MKSFAPATRLVCRVVALLALNGLTARAQEAGSPVPPSEDDEQVSKPRKLAVQGHYLLPRWAIRLELSEVPAVRFRCSLSFGGRQKVVEWDPQAPTGLQRLLYFPPFGPRGTGLFERNDRRQLSVVCGSEVLGKAEEHGRTEPFQYSTTRSLKLDLDTTDTNLSACSSDAAVRGEASYELKPILPGTLASPHGEPPKGTASNPVAARSIGITVNAVPACLGLSDLLGQEIPVTRARSFDPLTPVAADLVAVVTGIAVERAKTAAARLIRRNLEKRFCEELTGAKLENLLVGSGLSAPDRGPLLPHTCELVRVTTAETLAAIPRMLTRALMADLSVLLIRSLWAPKETLVPQEVLALLLGPIDSALSGLVEGRSVLSERDSQLLLLQAAQIACMQQPVPAGQPSKGKQSTLLSCESRRSIEAGLLLVVECIRDGQCSADELQRRLADEALQGTGFDFDRRMLSVFGRAVDVFQPPPGTPPRATAKVALNVVIDVLWYSRERIRENTVEQADASADLASAAFDRTLTLLRELANALSDEQPERAAQAAGEFLANTIAGRLERCEDRAELEPGRPAGAAKAARSVVATEGEDEAVTKRALGIPAPAPRVSDCDAFANVTPESVRRAFGILNTILAFGADGSASDSKGRGDVEKARMEERRKAMQQLIDAATDRAGRAGDLIVSIGTSVGGGWGWYRGRDADTWRTTRNGPGLSLPTGIAIEALPRRFFSGPLWVAGWHAQLTAFDLSQYVANPDGNDVKPEIGTAILPGMRVGLLLGDPDLCLLLSGGIGYAPRARFSEDSDHGMVRADLSAGIYVPIVDLN